MLAPVENQAGANHFKKPLFRDNYEKNFNCFSSNFSDGSDLKGRDFGKSLCKSSSGSPANHDMAVDGWSCVC